jgi:diguanylate cyclase (GGDEF)-like protein
LAGVLALLSGYTVYAGWEQAKVVDALSASQIRTDAYQDVAYLAARELAMIEAALRENSDAGRQQVLAADHAVTEAMTHLKSVDADQPLIAGMLAQQHVNLNAEIDRYVQQLDQGNTAAARFTLNNVIEPSSARITDSLLHAQDQQLETYAQQQADARTKSRSLMYGILLSFFAGLVVLGVFGWSSRTHRREVEALAATDALTGLPNRRAFNAQARLALQAAAAGPTALILNLDGFRAVNDQFGQHVGDLLLAECGHRLTAAIRAEDLVARLSGDEFAVLLREGDAADGDTVARRLLVAFDEPFVLESVTVDLEVSVGAATAQPGIDVTGLMRNADAAMHQAKQQHQGYHRFVAEDGHDPAARLTLLGDLRRALDDPAQLTLHYQPKVALGTGALAGVEALARWKHPVKGMISPGEFIPVVEATSLIHRFTDQVLAEALTQARCWLDAGHRVPVAVNISTRSLLDAGFGDRLTARLAESGVPAGLLCIEITEHTVMTDPETAIAALRRVRDLGVKTSIDDYGTGYSSMSYLKVLPVDELKIDRSFVCDVAEDTSSRALVASTVELGHNLGLSVVAEGVEDEATVAALRELGCDVAQGYFFSRPVPADELTGRIASYPSALAV